jgi:flagellar biosynthesis/type III secretory pathway protein FliH
MSALVTGDAARSARPFLEPIRPVPAPASDPRLQALELENEELRAALAAQRRAMDEGVAAARAEGQREGRSAAGEASEKRLAALGSGIAAASAAWEERLATLEGLAASVARTALAKLFEGAEGHSRFVAEVIARQMCALRRESLVSVRVSAGDFTDDTALTALAAAAGTGAVPVIADAGLEPGDCRIDLQLGHIDIGSRAQWTQLAALLDEMAAEPNE